MGYAAGTQVVRTADSADRPVIYTVVTGPNSKGQYLLAEPSGTWTTRLSEYIKPYVVRPERWVVEMRLPKDGEQFLEGGQILTKSNGFILTRARPVVVEGPL